MPRLRAGSAVWTDDYSDLASYIRWLPLRTDGKDELERTPSDDRARDRLRGTLATVADCASSNARGVRASDARWDLCIGMQPRYPGRESRPDLPPDDRAHLALRSRNGARASTRAFGSFASGRPGNGACRIGRRACRPRRRTPGLARAGRGSFLGSRDCSAHPALRSRGSSATGRGSRRLV